MYFRKSHYGKRHQVHHDSELLEFSSLQWRHTEREGVSNHPCLACLLNRLFRRRWKKRHQSSTSLAFLRRIHRGLVNSPNKGPVTRKMFLFDDVIMESLTYKLDSSLRRYFTQANDFLWDVKVKLTSSVTFKWYHFDSCSRNTKAKGYHADCLSSSAGSQVVTWSAFIYIYINQRDAIVQRRTLYVCTHCHSHHWIRHCHNTMAGTSGEGVYNYRLRNDYQNTNFMQQLENKN